MAALFRITRAPAHSQEYFVAHKIRHYLMTRMDVEGNASTLIVTLKQE